MSDRPPQVMRVFTRALKLPTLVGKLSEWRIPGGPYTVTQFAGGGLVIVVGITFADLLPWGWFTNRGLVLLVGFATTYVLRFVKVGGRDPLSASVALAGALGASPVGRIAGRVPVLPRPERVRTRRTWVLEDLPPAIAVAAATPTASQGAPASVPAATPAAQVGPARPTRGAPTGVAALLATGPTSSRTRNTTDGQPVAAPVGSRS